MQEEATVLDIDATGRTTVAVKRKAACGNCRICHSEDGNLMVTEAVNMIDARPGDRVFIEVDASLFFKAMLLLYGVPLIVFLFALVVSNFAFGAVGFSEASRAVFSGIFGFMMMVLSFFLIGRKDAGFKKRYLPKIVKAG